MVKKIQIICYLKEYMQNQYVRSVHTRHVETVMVLERKTLEK